MKKNRNVTGNAIKDSGSIANLTYNEAAGAQKNAEVGRCLVPLFDGTTYTTNATAAKSLPGPGKNLAIYNNAGAVGSVTLGSDGTVTSLAPGVCAGGNVGIPCKANDWTFLACNDKTFVIASAATLLVFVIEDESFIKVEVSR